MENEKKELNTSENKEAKKQQAQEETTKALACMTDYALLKIFGSFK